MVMTTFFLPIRNSLDSSIWCVATFVIFRKRNSGRQFMRGQSLSQNGRIIYT